jgi:signal transduction histidine kinase
LKPRWNDLLGRCWSVAYIALVLAVAGTLAAVMPLYRGEPVVIPFAVMFLGWLLLIGVSLLQKLRDRQQLADVIAARAAEAASEASLRALVEAIPTVIVIIDPTSESPSFINPAAAALIDPAPDHPEWRRLARAAIEGMRAGRADLELTLQRRGGGAILLRGAGRQVVWEGRAQVLLALADTTQLRHAELQVLQAAKLATLGEMASAIAHELNQPLAVIKMAASNARRLMAGGAASAQIEAKLDRISEQVDRAKRITDQVRRYARLPSQQTVSFALGHAIERAAGFVAEQYRAAGIYLAMAVDLPAELKVLGEETLFEQVIVNLLINARDAFDATAPEGRIPEVRIRAQVFGGEVTIEVADNAGGIRADILGRLFEPFATSKPADKGTGLGLSLSRKVIKDMNGTIAAANVGEGARFTICLPVVAQPRRVSEVAGNQTLIEQRDAA